MASLPSLPWTEQQETLRSMKALLERWLKTSAEKMEADALARQLYHLSLEQTLQNVAATVSSSVSRITTASLELLQLLLRCVTPRTASEQSGVFVNLVRRVLDESFMSSENAHSRAGVEIVATVLRIGVATINVPLVAVFVKRYATTSLFAAGNLLRFTMTVAETHREALLRQGELTRLADGLTLLIRMDAAPISRLLREFLPSLLREEAMVTAVLSLPASKRRTFIDFIQREKLPVEVERLRGSRVVRGRSDLSVRSESRSVASRLSLTRPVFSDQDAVLAGVSLVDAETDITREELEEPESLSMTDARSATPVGLLVLCECQGERDGGSVALRDHSVHSQNHSMQSPIHPIHSPYHPTQPPIHTTQSPIHTTQSPIHTTQSPYHSTPFSTPSKSSRILTPVKTPLHTPRESDTFFHHCCQKLHSPTCSAVTLTLSFDLGNRRRCPTPAGDACATAARRLRALCRLPRRLLVAKRGNPHSAPL